MTELAGDSFSEKKLFGKFQAIKIILIQCRLLLVSHHKEVLLFKGCSPDLWQAIECSSKIHASKVKHEVNYKQG